jgi:hypothetical protein
VRDDHEYDDHKHHGNDGGNDDGEVAICEGFRIPMSMCTLSQAVGKHEGHIEPHFSHQLNQNMLGVLRFIFYELGHLQRLLVIIFTFPAKPTNKREGHMTAHLERTDA